MSAEFMWNVYSASDHETAQRFCDKYELGSCWSSYDEFLADVDIVYIKTSLNRRAEYIERALKKENMRSVIRP